MRIGENKVEGDSRERPGTLYLGEKIMDTTHLSARCGCGAVVRLPNLKARAYAAKCEACIAKARAMCAAPLDWTSPGVIRERPPAWLGLDPGFRDETDSSWAQLSPVAP